MKWPIQYITYATVGQTSIAVIIPTISVTAGVTIISILVSPETSFPISHATRTQRNAPAGPADTAFSTPSDATMVVSISLPHIPTTPDAKRTRAGALRA